MTNTSSHEWGSDHLNSFPYTSEPTQLTISGPYIQTHNENVQI